jgi:methionine-rich copper-binding protein CopC
VLLGPAAPAGAHAFLVASSPGDGEVLTAAPRQVRLDFSESVQLGAARVEVSDGRGRIVTLTGLRLVPRGAAGEGEVGEPVRGPEPRAAVGATEQPVSLVAELPELPRGAYRLSWETVSSDDLHRAAGAFAFGIGDAVTPVGPAESLPDAAGTAGRWVLLGGASLALGGALVALWLARPLPDEDRVRARRSAVRLGTLGAAVAGMAAVGLLVVDVVRSGPAALTMAYAVRWLVRAAGLALLLVGFWSTGRDTRAPGDGPPGARARGAALAVVAGGGLACLGTVIVGHEGAVGGLSWVVASTLHVAAGLVWAGTVAVLAVLVVLERRTGRRDLGPALRAFRSPAVVAAGAAAVSGVYLASDVVGSVDAVLATAYGRTLLLKVALVGVAALLGWATTRRLRSTPVTRSVRPVAVEALVLTAVLAGAGALAAGQPALQPEFVETTAPSELLAGRVADLQESITVRPNRPGESVVLVDVHDSRRPSPGPVTAVVITLGAASVGASRAPEASASADGTSPGTPRGVDATPVDAGRWAATVRLPAAGSLPIGVVVHRRGLPDAVATWTWTVGSGAPTRAVLVSMQPATAPLRWAATSLAAGLLLAGWVALERARSRRAGGAPSVRGERRTVVRP